MKSKLINAAKGTKNLAAKGIDKIDVEAIKDKAGDMKDKAVEVKGDLSEKIHELDKQLEEAIVEYNDQYTIFNDYGYQLFLQRTRAIDIIDNVENLVNSIANRPSSFDTDFEEIESNKAVFKGAEEFATEQLEAARKAAGGAGAGMAAGAAVVSMAPSAAMWVATTFGTASTGTAISSLSGAAATNAALAWLGGGSLAAGGGGVAGGTAFLAMAGPVGIGIAGASLLVSIALFSKNKIKKNKEKSEEIESVKNNTLALKENTLKLRNIMAETITLRDNLNETFNTAMQLYGSDFKSLDDESKLKLGALLNNTKNLSALLGKTI